MNTNYEYKTDHIIKAGESLFGIAKKYGITLYDLLDENPGAHPHNLRIGDKLKICVPEKHEPFIDLNRCMRSAWADHSVYTHLVIVSTVDKNPDESYITDRLLKNPDIMANCFLPYYGEQIAAELSKIVKDHLEIGKQLIISLRDHDPRADELSKKWYENADEWAMLLNKISTKMNYGEQQEMLHKHLDLVTASVKTRLNHDYNQDPPAFDAAMKEAYMMADNWSEAIKKQFPNRF